MPANRTATGQFTVGKSGNPSGRPKVPQEVREAIRAACPEAVETLIGIMRNVKEKTPYRLEAAKILLERGYGKPEAMSKVELTTTEDTKIIFHWINEDPNNTATLRTETNAAGNSPADRDA